MSLINKIKCQYNIVEARYVTIVKWLEFYRDDEKVFISLEKPIDVTRHFPKDLFNILSEPSNPTELSIQVTADVDANEGHTFKHVDFNDIFILWDRKKYKANWLLDIKDIKDTWRDDCAEKYKE